MTIMEIIIPIRANHWSFQGENYPSVTCPSPGTLSKCPYYHHQGHSVCLLLDVCLCQSVCVCVTNPLTPYHTLLSSPSEEPVCVCGDKAVALRAPQGAAAAISLSVTEEFCRRSRGTLCVSVGPSWPIC